MRLLFCIFDGGRDKTKMITNNLVEGEESRNVKMFQDKIEKHFVRLKTSGKQFLGSFFITVW